MNDLFENPVAWEQGLVTRRRQWTSFLQHLAPMRAKREDPKAGGQTTRVLQMYISTPQEQYNSVACDISQKHICKDKEFQ